MRGLPKELEESAVLDGASRATTFFRIILPVSKPGLAAVGTLTFLYAWNEFLLASVIIASSPTAKTLPLGIFALQGLWSTDYGPLSAGLMLSILPVLVVYLIFQEQVIEGATAGAVVG
jgi:raffinose/stachyose/melibiose transport system permease protein